MTTLSNESYLKSLGLDSHYEITEQKDSHTSYLHRVNSDNTRTLINSGFLSRNSRGYTFEQVNFNGKMTSDYLNPKIWAETETEN